MWSTQWTKRIVSVSDPLELEVARNSISVAEGLVAVWPIRTNGAEGRWTLGAETLSRYVTEGKAKVGHDSWTLDL